MFSRTFRPILASLIGLSVLGLSLTPAQSATAAATDRFIDCSAASNGTGSQSSPWNALSSANSTTFGPGDRVLLRRGTACVGQLGVSGSGTAAAPIQIDAYGSGSNPRIDAAGLSSQAVLIANQEYVQVANLELTNTGTGTAVRRGIYVTISDFGVSRGIVLHDLNIHNVNGNNKKDVAGSGGIIVDARGSQKVSWFDGVTIRNNTVTTVDRTGIGTASEWWCRASVGISCSSATPWTPFKNVSISHNSVSDVGGDGIVVENADGAVVEYNKIDRAAQRDTGADAALWPWNADNTLFQYNEVSRTGKLPTNNDGQALDIDFGTNNTVFQYNYTHDNAGGMLLYCGCLGTATNSTVRYNVSQNDGLRVIQGYGAQGQGHRFYNNTIYLSPGATAAITGAGGGTNVLFENNIIVNLGTGGYSTTSPQTLVWSHNLFSGNHASTEPFDSFKLTSNPQFANPGGAGFGLAAVAAYQLSSTSPALGAGVLVPGAPQVDILGNPIPIGCAPDLGAIQRTATCAPGSLIAANGSFNSGSLAPWSSWNSAGVRSGAGLSGTPAARVGPGPASVEQVVTLKAGTSYVVTGWGRVASAGEAVRIGVKNFGNGAQRYGETTSTSFGALSTAFTTGSTTTTATIYCYKPTGSSDGYCDDVQVQELPDVVANPGFESGQSAPWSGWGAASVVTGNAHSGTSALRIGPGAGGVEQNVPVLPNTTYTLTGWTKGAAAGSETRVGIKNYNATETWASTSGSVYGANTLSITTGPNAYTATVYCYAPGSGTSYCDDISLKP